MPAYFQLAGLYGPETILTALGVPVPSSPVTVYVQGTLTTTTLYTDQFKATTSANPVNTDGYGNLAFFAQPGLYDLAFTVGGVPTTKTVLVEPYLTDCGTPSGVIMAYGANGAPNGWLSCDGSAVSRISNASLFTVIGTNWGVGDGSTTFNLPDARGRSLFGANGFAANNTQPLLTFATGGGEWAHLLTTPEIPSHNHVQDSGEAAGVGDGGSTVGLAATGATKIYATWGPLSTAYTGGGGTHNNMQPYVVVNHIIKV